MRTGKHDVLFYFILFLVYGPFMIIHFSRADR